MTCVIIAHIIVFGKRVNTSIQKKHREEVPNEKDRKNHEELRKSSHHGIG